MRRVVIYERGKGNVLAAARLFGALLFALCNLYLVIAGRDYDDPSVFVSPWGGFLLSGLVSLIFLRKLLQTAPAIILDEDGITYRPSSTAGGFMPWCAIREVKIAVFRPDYPQGKHLDVLLHNPFPYRLKMRPPFRNRWPSGSGSDEYRVLIFADGLQISVERLAEKIRVFRKHYSAAQFTELMQKHRDGA